MKGIKKGKVSQRQTMDMKQNMLDHFLKTGSMDSGNKAALIRQTKAKSVKEELPGLMKQRKQHAAKSSAQSPDSHNRSHLNNAGVSFDGTSDQRHASTRKETNYRQGVNSSLSNGFDIE